MPLFQHTIAKSLLLLLLWLGLSPLCLAQSEAPNTYSASKGVIDLRKVDFNSSAPLELSGDWEFLWGQLLGPEELASKVSDFGLQRVPFSWNNMGYNSNQGSGSGYMTLRLKLLLPPGTPPLALAIPEQNSAYSLWVNGELLAQRGRVGESAQSEQPHLQRQDVRLPQGTELELLFNISNHFHSRGGMLTAPRIASEEMVVLSRRMANGYHLLALGGMLMVTLYAMVLLLNKSRDPSQGYFVLLSVLVLLHLVSASRLLYTLSAHIPFGVLFNLGYIALALIPGAFLLFLQRLFRHEISALVGYHLLLLGFILSLVILFTPASFFTHAFDGYQLILLFTFGYAVYGSIRAFINGRQGSLWGGAAALALGGSIFHDFINQSALEWGADWVPMGFLLFALGHASMLASRANGGEPVAKPVRSSASRRQIKTTPPIEIKLTPIPKRNAESMESPAELGVSSKVTQLTRGRANSALVASDRSAELTPLMRSIMTLSEQLAQTDLSDTQRLYVEGIHQTSRRMDVLMGAESGVVPALSTTTDNASASDSGEVLQGVPYVLILDENPLSSMTITNVLRQDGYQVGTATSMQEAFALLRRQPFDLLLLDMNLTEMDGVTAITKIRQMKDSNITSLVVIGMTDNLPSEGDHRFTDAGIDQLLPRPLQDEQLLELLDDYLLERPSRLLPLSDPDKSVPEYANMPLLDEKLLILRREELGSEKVIELLTLFRSTGQERMEGLDNAHAQQAYGDLESVAHTLKGASATLGLSALQGACSELEKIAQSGKSMEIRENIEVIHSLYDHTLLALDAFKSMYLEKRHSRRKRKR